MLREEVLSSWNDCQAKVFKFKTEGIGSKYVIMNKRVILGLYNRNVYSPRTVYDFTVANGVVIDKRELGKSRYVVGINTELLKVAIIEYLGDNEPVEDAFLTNYDSTND